MLHKTLEECRQFETLDVCHKKRRNARFTKFASTEGVDDTRGVRWRRIVAARSRSEQLVFPDLVPDASFRQVAISSYRRKTDEVGAHTYVAIGSTSIRVFCSKRNMRYSREKRVDLTSGTIPLCGPTSRQGRSRQYSSQLHITMSPKLALTKVS